MIIYPWSLALPPHRPRRPWQCGTFEVYSALESLTNLRAHMSNLCWVLSQVAERRNQAWLSIFKTMRSKFARESAPQMASSIIVEYQVVAWPGHCI